MRPSCEFRELGNRFMAKSMELWRVQRLWPEGRRQCHLQHGLMRCNRTSTDSRKRNRYGLEVVGDFRSVDSLYWNILSVKTLVTHVKLLRSFPAATSAPPRTFQCPWIFFLNLPYVETLVHISLPLDDIIRIFGCGRISEPFPGYCPVLAKNW